MNSLIQKIKKSIIVFAASVYVRIETWIKKLHVSPITRWYCDKKLIESVRETAIYQMAEKAILIKEPKGYYGPLDQIRPAYKNEQGVLLSTMKPQTIGGNLTYRPVPEGFGKVFPFPSEFVRYFAQTNGEVIKEGLDGVFVQQIADRTEYKDRVIYKKCVSKGLLYKAWLGYHNGYFVDKDGTYLLCITSVDRIETHAFMDQDEWEDEMIYQDYIGRPLYPGEYGRYKLQEGLYIVFLTTLDDRMQHSLLFGPGTFTALPLEKNLHTLFRKTSAGLEVGYQMDVGIVADSDCCVVLEATKRLEKKE